LIPFYHFPLFYTGSTVSQRFHNKLPEKQQTPSKTKTHHGGQRKQSTYHSLGGRME
jgi:hypothetical protein